jgi:hypothetical protein
MTQADDVTPDGLAPQTELAATWPSQPAPTGAVPVSAPAVVAAPATSSNGIVALVLAISSWIILPFALGWVFAIIGLVFAGKGAREIADSDGRVGGQGFVTAARIVAWINIGVTAALAVLAVVVIGIVIAAGAMSEGMN